ncbi:VanZ family protein [Streptomyces bomunensis]|uniref:VanZ family protein n=2 Tax=Streptomyces montanisoli TaxID=2798581 RepID=A0A940S180_9ACTN|nr:VanZ family protein [Streptomyces montanisoli]MBP0461694.1 VanZ family protein [Streptomyces montanisoli]
MARSWGRTALRLLILVLAFAALVAFSAVLAELTLTPSPASKNIAGANLHPGHSLREYVDDYTFLGACKQIGGNLLIGAPFGVILPVLVARRLRMVRVVLLTCVVMVLVELAQGAMVEGRAFDVDDVILNTAGALIGYLLVGRLIGRRYHRLAEARPVRRSRWRSAVHGKTPKKPAAEKPAAKAPVTRKPSAKRPAAKAPVRRGGVAALRARVTKRRDEPEPPEPAWRRAGGRLAGLLHHR